MTQARVTRPLCGRDRPRSTLFDMRDNMGILSTAMQLSVMITSIRCMEINSEFRILTLGHNALYLNPREFKKLPCHAFVSL